MHWRYRSGTGILAASRCNSRKIHPQSLPHSGDRIYRTGDLVRRLPDGNIEFLGRIDFQVKLRGFRIELGEIEAAIQQINDILTTAVILREDIPGNKYLAAYYTTQSGLALPAEQIISHLKQQLPDYMVPTAFVHLDQFPLTPNGKINRRALPKPDEQQIRTQVKTAPRTPVEELLAAIWADILKIDNIGANDNFLTWAATLFQQPSWFHGFAMRLMLKYRLKPFLNSQFLKN